MNHRSKDYPHHNQKNEAGIEGIGSGKDLSGCCAQLSHRAHPAQDHGGIYESIDPGKAFKRMVADHADAQRAKDQGQANDPVTHHSADKIDPVQQRLAMMFIHVQFNSTLSSVREGKR